MTKRSLGVAAVFLVGCAVGGVSSQLVVPKASAEQEAELPAWEYKCVAKDFRWAETTERANKMGAARWEAFAIDQKDNLWCFKRTKM
jgi:hypothetical protein